MVYGGTDRVLNDQYGWTRVPSAPAMSAAHADLEGKQQGRDGHDECDQLCDLDIAHSGSLHEHGLRGIRAESRRVRGLLPIDRLGK